MKKSIKNILPAAALLLSMGLSSCIGDLDVTPIDPNKNTKPNPDQLFTKCYADLALAGQSGPDGDCDIDRWWYDWFCTPTIQYQRASYRRSNL